jgi:NTE family protein
MKRALVLGGGGRVGVAWEIGLTYGLVQGGFALDSVDAIVGTSAGAIVGAQLAHGKLPAVAKPEATGPDGDSGERPAAARRPAHDPSTIDMKAIMQIFAIWETIERSTPEQSAAIGKIVSALDRSREAEWLREIAGSIHVSEWGERRLLVCAVDAESGERRVFERGDGVPLVHAVAASSAVPGLFSAVEIDGRLYMDGQVHSSTNADVLVPDRPAQVLIAMPTNVATSRNIGAHAERMLDGEVEALRAAGSEVLIKTPSSEDSQRMGGNLMDLSRVRDAFAVGLATGRAWAQELG